MAAKRCLKCDTNWPLGPSFHRCPECDGLNDYAPNARPVDDEIANRALFEKACRERDADRERRGLPSPETLGRLEARRILDLDRCAVA